MPPKKRKTTTRRRQMGGSAFTDFFTKTLPNVGRKIYDGVKYVKDNKLVSKVAKAIPIPTVQAFGQKAEQAGFGRRRRKRRPQMGGARGSAAMSI